MDQQINKNNTKLEIGQLVKIKNCKHYTLEQTFLVDYKVLKILNDTTLLLITPNGKERKTNINDVKPCSITQLVENSWDSFLGLIKTKHQNCSYNLRPQPYFLSKNVEQYNHLLLLSIFRIIILERHHTYLI